MSSPQRKKIGVMELKGYHELEKIPMIAIKKLFELANDAGLKAIPLSELSFEKNDDGLKVFCYRYYLEDEIEHTLEKL